ncbi:MAG: hypothetical protein FWC43_03500 [Planctomycetaceae bacterium]|nr:hypothetical protein [Planctomycetaceae bacterium]MCL2304388.1 hypothetical protein [Planctomycetaceae bacterium]
MIPIGFGFALAVYLKWEYENPASRPDESETSSGKENILDILKESNVVQDILMVKNKASEEEPDHATSDTNILNRFLQEGSESVPEKQETELQPNAAAIRENP